ncbi:hypothetical protein KCU88_g226, partial [Aureobasidium melanogenum]
MTEGESSLGGGCSFVPYLSTGNNDFHLTTGGAHQGAKLLTGSLEQAEPVVLGESGQKVLDRAALVGATGVFLQLRHNLRLVRVRQGWGRQDRLQFRVALENLGQAGDRFGVFCRKTPNHKSSSGSSFGELPSVLFPSRSESSLGSCCAARGGEGGPHEPGGHHLERWLGEHNAGKMDRASWIEAPKPVIEERFCRHTSITLALHRYCKIPSLRIGHTIPILQQSAACRGFGDFQLRHDSFPIEGSIVINRCVVGSSRLKLVFRL